MPSSPIRCDTTVTRPVLSRAAMANVVTDRQQRLQGGDPPHQRAGGERLQGGALSGVASLTVEGGGDVAERHRTEQRA